MRSLFGQPDHDLGVEGNVVGIVALNFVVQDLEAIVADGLKEIAVDGCGGQADPLICFGAYVDYESS